MYQSKRAPRCLLAGNALAIAPLLLDLLVNETKLETAVLIRKDLEAEYQERIEAMGYAPERVRIHTYKPGETSSLTPLLEWGDLLVVAGPDFQHSKWMVEAALRARLNYYDLYGSVGRLEIQRAHVETIRDYGHHFITEGGFLPGMPGLLCREAARHLDRVQDLRIFVYENCNWATLPASPRLREDLVQHMHVVDRSLYRQGVWKQTVVPLRRKHTFGNGIGATKCLPFFCQELKEAQPQLQGLQSLGVWLAGAGFWTDRVVSPLYRHGSGFLRELMGNLFLRTVTRMERCALGAAMAMEASGYKDGQKMRYTLELFHPDACMFNALIGLGTLEQFLSPNFKAPPGLHLQAEVVEPRPLIDLLAAKGVTIEENLRPG